MDLQKTSLNVVLIGYDNSRIHQYLDQCCNLIFIDGNTRITLDWLKKIDPDFIVLHGCHYILPADIVKEYHGRIINHHGGFLPWNRGAHPNLWSFIDDTPKGGTIHYVTNGIDDGDIIIQRMINVEDCDTLSTTYWKIRDLLEDMFIEVWPDIIQFNITASPQNNELATFHKRSDIDKVLNRIQPLLWETPIRKFYEND